MTRYLRTETIPLDQLTPFPGNARRGRVDVIKESIEKNGQYRSLVVREIKDGPLIVLAGNHTMLAIAELKGKQARCEIIDCDEQTARRINLVDNRSNDLAEDDEDALTELLRGLDDAAGSGYTQDEMDAYTREPDIPHFEPELVEQQPRLDQSAVRECPSCHHKWRVNASGDPVGVDEGDDA
jgi:hypothetical protein